jgi:hypothetical protein
MRLTTGHLARRAPPAVLGVGALALTAALNPAMGCLVEDGCLATSSIRQGAGGSAPSSHQVAEPQGAR